MLHVTLFMGLFWWDGNSRRLVCITVILYSQHSNGNNNDMSAGADKIILNMIWFYVILVMFSGMVSFFEGIILFVILLSLKSFINHCIVTVYSKYSVPPDWPLHLWDSFRNEIQMVGNRERSRILSLSLTHFLSK